MTPPFQIAAVLIFSPEGYLVKLFNLGFDKRGEIMDYYGYMYYTNQNKIEHHGVMGMKWGVRRYQNADGSVKPGGEAHIKALYKKNVGTLRKDEARVKKDTATIQKETTKANSYSAKLSQLSSKYNKYSAKANKLDSKANKLDYKSSKIQKKLDKHGANDDLSNKQSTLDAKSQQITAKNAKNHAKADKYEAQYNKLKAKYDAHQAKAAKASQRIQKTVSSGTKYVSAMKQVYSKTPVSILDSEDTKYLNSYVDRITKLAAEATV